MVWVKVGSVGVFKKSARVKRGCHKKAGVLCDRSRHWVREKEGKKIDFAVRKKTGKELCNAVTARGDTGKGSQKMRLLTKTNQ